MARPTKYTPATVERICEGIRLGLTYELAAGYGGIDYRTFVRWRESKGQFRQAVQEAEAKGAAVNMARINKEAQEGDWRAAAWIMEHRYPDQYGRSVHEHHGEMTARVELVGIAAEDV